MAAADREPAFASEETHIEVVPAARGRWEIIRLTTRRVGRASVTVRSESLGRWATRSIAERKADEAR